MSIPSEQPKHWKPEPKTSLVYLGFATRRTFRRLVQISMVIIALGSVLIILITALQCPEEPSYAVTAAAIFDRKAHNCLDLGPIFYTQAGFSIGSVIFIILLPMPLLLSLHMRKIDRICLVAVFAVSLLIPIASIVRLWALHLWTDNGSYTYMFWSVTLLWFAHEIH